MWDKIQKRSIAVHDMLSSELFKIDLVQNCILLLLLLLLLLLTAIGFLPGGSGYFTCIQNLKLVTTKLSR